MRRRNFLGLVGGVGATGLAGCLAGGSSSSAPSPTPSAFPDAGTPPAVDGPTDAFVAGNANFGLALQQRLAARKPHENRVTSPYSLGVALAMTYAGARGTTREQMARAVNFRPRGADLHRSIAALRADLPIAGGGTPTPSPTAPEESPTGEDSGLPFRLLAANAVWLQAGFPVRESYRELLGEYYAVDVGTADFKSAHARARRRINRWVNTRTREEIPELFPPNSLSPRTRLVLANAVYFRANWADTFREENTEPATFTALDGSEGRVPMMRESVEAHYARVDGHRILRLPYAGPDVDMVVLLPAEGAFRSFERSLDAARLDELLAATESREGEVAMPRFSFRSPLSLPDYLRAMGMKRAFTSRADFTGMASGSAGERLAVGDVRHEATITVDEQGTEAAAATGVEIVLVSAPANPFEITLDRPFLFAIRHRDTGAVLFLGRVVDAAAAQP